MTTTYVTMKVTGLDKLPFGNNLSVYKAEVMRRLEPIIQAHWAATVDAFLYALYYAPSRNAFSKHNFSGAMMGFYAPLWKRVYREWPHVSAIQEPHRDAVGALPGILTKTRYGFRKGQEAIDRYWSTQSTGSAGARGRKGSSVTHTIMGKLFGDPLNIGPIRYSSAPYNLFNAGKRFMGSQLNFDQVSFRQNGNFRIAALMPEHRLGVQGIAGHGHTRFGEFTQPLREAENYFKAHLPRQVIRQALLKQKYNQRHNHKENTPWA